MTPLDGMTPRQEQFECCSCYHVGPLNEQGRCERCLSEAVITQELVSRKVTV